MFIFLTISLFTWLQQNFSWPLQLARKYLPNIPPFSQNVTWSFWLDLHRVSMPFLARVMNFVIFTLSDKSFFILSLSWAICMKISMQVSHQFYMFNLWVRQWMLYTLIHRKMKSKQKQLCHINEVTKVGLVSLFNGICIFTNPSARARYDTKSVFKRSLTVLNSEFSFS